MDRSGSDPNRNGEDPALRELAARLLATRYSDGAETEQPQLFVGRLPNDLPVQVPIPDEATVVGCAAHKPPRGGRFVQIVLDATLPAERFLEAYRRQLLSAGWSGDASLPGRSGFVPRGLPRLFRYAASRSSRLRRRLRGRVPGLPELLDHFVLGEHGPRLLVIAHDQQNAPTDVRLSLVVKQREPWLHHDIAWTVVPSLSSPRDIRRSPEPHETNVLHPPPDTAGGPRGGGEPYEPDGAYSYATLETGLDLAELTAHYAAQLEESGWTQTDEGQSGPQAWSAWTLRDEKDRPWTGAFTVLRLSQAPEGTSDRYLLQIHATLTPNR